MAAISWKASADRALAAGEHGTAVMCLLEGLNAPQAERDVAFTMVRLPRALCLFSAELSAQGETPRATWLWETSVAMAARAIHADEGIWGNILDILRYHYARSADVHLFALRGNDLTFRVFIVLDTCFRKLS